MVRIAISVGVALALLAATRQASAQYRGMTPGWPQQTGGNYAAYYPGNAYGGPAYFVARPTYAAGYAPAAYAPAGYTAYMPVAAAYANPGYAAAYGAAPTYAQRPATTAAYYGGSPAGYYAPVQAGYAPLQSYRIAPAGGSTAGAEAYAGYGQPTTVNYVPPRFVYQTNYAAVPVYMYRPVTVYDPVTAQPVTCLQPATTTGCQAQRQRLFSHSWFSWLHPSHGGCGSAPAAAPTTAYCASGNCQSTCGQQPYYPVQPGVIIPTIPGPATTAPPQIYTPMPAGPTVPPPATRFPASSGTLAPADTVPSLGTPPRGTILQPGVQPGTILPRNPVPAPSFPVDPTPGGTFIPPAGTPAGSGFGGPTGFPGGTNYAPTSDPYTNSSLSGPALKPPAASAAPTLSPGIRPIPDPNAGEQPRPVNRAPQLLDPRDKTATGGDQRWAVVPAVWPVKDRVADAEPTEARRTSPYRAFQERSLISPAADAAEYDDSGWASSR